MPRRWKLRESDCVTGLTADWIVRVFEFHFNLSFSIGWFFSGNGVKFHNCIFQSKLAIYEATIAQLRHVCVKRCLTWAFIHACFLQNVCNQMCNCF